MTDEIVLTWPKTRGKDMNCSEYGKVITVGDKFIFLRKDSGEMKVICTGCKEKHE